MTSTESPARGAALFVSASATFSVGGILFGPFAAGPGVALGLGVQASDYFAAYLWGSATALPLSPSSSVSDLSTALMFEGSPAKWLSLAAGPGVTLLTQSTVRLGVTSADLAVFPSLQTSTSINVPIASDRSGVRISLGVGVMLLTTHVSYYDDGQRTIDQMPSRGQVGLRLGLTVGYVFR